MKKKVLLNILTVAATAVLFPLIVFAANKVSEIDVTVVADTIAEYFYNEDKNIIAEPVFADIVSNKFPKDAELVEPVVEDTPEEPELLPPKTIFEYPETPITLENTLFIGDSRTVGICEYSGITEADFFAMTGMNVYNVLQSESEVGVHDGKTLSEVFADNQYELVFIMLGINELWGNIDENAAKYREVLDYILLMQSDAVVIIQGNLHVTHSRSSTDELYNNKRINETNSAASKFADKTRVFYIDPNVIFDDENGDLRSDFSSDNTHIYARHYPMWAEWIIQETTRVIDIAKNLAI